MKIVPAKNGWLWLRDGARIFSLAPVLWMLLVFSYWLGTSLVSAVPFVGPIIGLATVPALSVSFYNITRDIAAGKQVTPVMLLSGFRENLPALINLGVVYIVLLLVLFGVSWVLDDGVLARFLFAGRRPDDPAAIPVASVAIAAIGYAGIMFIMWFAPPLVAWRGMPALQALFYSVVAALRNWRALAVYALAIVGIFVAVMMTLGLLIALLAPNMLAGVAASGRGTGPGAFLVFVMLPAMLAGAAILIASFYTSYRDVFE